MESQYLGHGLRGCRSLSGSYLRRTLVLSLMLVFSGRSFAQTGGSLSGIVADPSGAVVAGASVTIKESRTNSERVATTDSAGRFVANVLQVGTYEIKISAAGFRQTSRSGILLEAQTSEEVDFVLAPAVAPQSVTVEGNAIAVDTADASLGQVVHSEQVSDLPLNGR